jgi:hypothetical protein
VKTLSKKYCITWGSFLGRGGSSSCGSRGGAKGGVVQLGDLLHFLLHPVRILQLYETLHPLNIYFLDKKIAIYLSLGLHKGRPSYRRGQPSKENIQHFKT